MQILRERRRALGMSQQQLASHLHVDQSAVSRWERGQPVPRDVAARLAEVLQAPELLLPEPRFTSDGIEQALAWLREELAEAIEAAERLDMRWRHAASQDYADVVQLYDLYAALAAYLAAAARVAGVSLTRIQETYRKKVAAYVR